MKFDGFDAAGAASYAIPGQFFTELLLQIDSLDELRLTLYVFWRLHLLEGNIRFLRPDQFAADSALMQSLGSDPAEQRVRLNDGLDRAVRRGTLLRVEAAVDGETIYFLNTPRGRAAVQGLQKGDWRPEDLPDLEPGAAAERPGIFELYETHIGPLTPMLAETLQDAEASYPPAWIEDAIRIAVENNVRRWRYVEAILKSWQEQGRDDRRDKQSTEEDRRKYIQGEFARFIEH